MGMEEMVRGPLLSLDEGDRGVLAERDCRGDGEILQGYG